MRVEKKPLSIRSDAVKDVVSKAVETEKPSEQRFVGVHKEAPLLPVSSTPGQGSMAVRLGQKDVPPGRALALQIVPQSSTSSDLSQVTNVAEALATAKPAELLALAQQRFVERQTEAMAGPLPRLELGPQFVDIGRLVPAQTRIAIDRVVEKVALQVQLNGFDGLSPKHDDGRATVPQIAVKPAVAGPGGKVLVLDGNHQAVASMLAGAKSVPIDIVADLQDVDEKTFWKTAEQKGWLYLNEKGGAPGQIDAASYAKLDDDPLRFVLSEIALKGKKEGGQIIYEETDRLDERVWVKMKGPTVDFVEFKLADVLYRAADQDPEVAKGLAGDQRSQADTARRVFHDAARRGEFDPAAFGILLLDAGATFDQITPRVAAAIP